MSESVHPLEKATVSFQSDDGASFHGAIQLDLQHARGSRETGAFFLRTTCEIKFRLEFEGEMSEVTTMVRLRGFLAAWKKVNRQSETTGHREAV